MFISHNVKQLNGNKLVKKEYLANPGYNSITSELELNETEHGEVLTFMFCDESPWDFEKETQIIYFLKFSFKQFLFVILRNFFIS